MAFLLLLLLIRINLLLFLSCTFSPPPRGHQEVTQGVNSWSPARSPLLYLRLREDFRAPDAAAAAAAGADLVAFLAGVAAGGAALLDEALPPLAAVAFGVAFDCLGGGGGAFLLPPLFLALL